MTIRRWASYNEQGYYSDSSLVSHELGDWVKYNDHVKIVDNLLYQLDNYEAITGEDYND